MKSRQNSRHSVSTRRRLGLTALKRFMYGQLMIMQGIKVMFGRSVPYVRFTVEEDPPSVYVNFRVKADQRAAFEKRCNIAPGLEFAELRALDSDEPFLCLTANIYRVSGLANGIRLEWSTYIKDVDGTPRYMVVDAVSSLFSIDPVEIFTPTGTCEYTGDGKRLKAHAEHANGGSVDFDFELPSTAPEVLPSREWVEANDMIYWANGVADRCFYDAGFHNTPMWNIPHAASGLTDTTEWAQYLEPEPAHFLVCSGPIDIVMSPWWNLSDCKG